MARSTILGPGFGFDETPVAPPSANAYAYPEAIGNADTASLSDMRDFMRALATPQNALDMTGLPDVRRGVGQFGLGMRYGETAQMLGGLSDVGIGLLNLLPAISPAKMFKLLKARKALKVAPKARGGKVSKLAVRRGKK